MPANVGSHEFAKKDLALVRRFYGDRRCKRPMLRKGFKQWVDDGFPRDPQTGAVDPEKYLRRGRDAWVAVTWDEALDYSARSLWRILRRPTLATKESSVCWRRATIR